ncbi:MAG: AbrB/MazE/SpoVT family DNA-binding domain-containing protein [Holophagaceae bacterium]
MTIPADLLKLRDIKAGDALELDVTPDGFVVRKADASMQKRLTLAELLEGVTKQSLKALNSQVAPAMAGGPVGRELA